MSGSEATALPPDLTITEAARAFGTGRRLVRAKLHAGAFPNANKDAQGFWRIPEADLLAAGFAPDGSRPDREPLSVPVPPPVPAAAEAEELARLRIEVMELRHRVERAEDLLEAERRLSDERARALEVERATVETLYRQAGVSRPAPKPVEAPRGDWQASMRAARDRDRQMRAARERAARTDPAVARAVDTVTLTETPDDDAPAGTPDRRHRWRRH